MAQSPHKHVHDDNQQCGKMDRVHLDLVGPLTVISAHGAYSYFQAGIDVGTRLSFVNLLKKKSDALAVSKVAIAALEADAHCNDAQEKSVDACTSNYTSQKAHKGIGKCT